MKTKIILLVSFFMLNIFGVLKAQDQHADSEEGIQFFKGSWGEALQKAKEDNKPIFLDVYASWCGPCKKLKKETFPNADAGTYFNENYINVTLDAEKGDGIELAKSLNVHAYPSLFILNSEGDPVVYYPGYLGPDDLIELGIAGIERLKIN